MAYIKVHPGMQPHWRHLSKKQILYLLYWFSGDMEKWEGFKRRAYKGNKVRSEKDREVIIKFKPFVDEMRALSSSSNRTNILFNKLKIETLYLMEALNKREILIILYFIDVYRVNLKREYRFKLKKLLLDIFGEFKDTELARYKKILVDTLNTVKEWKYSDGSVFINSYNIQGKYINISLDKGSKLEIK